MEHIKIDTATQRYARAAQFDLDSARWQSIGWWPHRRVGNDGDGDQRRRRAGMLPVRAKNPAAPLVQLIGIDLVRLRETCNGTTRLAGLFDQLAFEFGSEVTSFEHICSKTAGSIPNAP